MYAENIHDLTGKRLPNTGFFNEKVIPHVYSHQAGPAAPGYYAPHCGVLR